MPSQNEKQRRKELTDNLIRKQKEEFENNLPMFREQFLKLFKFLDESLEHCDHTLNLTETFLTHNNILDKEKVIQWLREYGGYCDCEVIANVEENFE